MYSFRNASPRSLFFNSKDPILETKAIVSEYDNTENCVSKPWRPVTFRRPFLGAMILLTGILITAVAVLLRISIRDRGIIFAAETNDLPLRKSFGYLYLPTIISVVYSFLWAWIDLDIKRLEPYFQLSSGEPKAGDSILLSYPLEFLITVPFSALKRKHWSVLSGSVVMMLIFWGLTPTQAGIFAVRTVTISVDILSARSTAYLSLKEQGNLTADYAQSVYNIAWLNESLPPFMTKEYALAPFASADRLPSEGLNVSMMGNTTLYSVDIACEAATLWNNSGLWAYNTSNGCSFNAPLYRPGGGNDTSKPFDTLYVGYQNRNGFAMYDLSFSCSSAFAHYFLVRWSKSSMDGILAANEYPRFSPDAANATTLFCEATYYQQDVLANITLPKYSVQAVQANGDKRPLPADMFNISTFEWAMNSGQEEFPTWGDFPSYGFPDQKPQLLNMPLNLDFIPQMSPFAIATMRRPMQDYLDPQVLSSSYQAAYRLLFSRQISDILSSTVDRRITSTGTMSYTTQAVVVVPGFAIAVLILLGIVLLFAVGMALWIPRRTSRLSKDPSSIDALMDMLSGEEDTCRIFGALDRSDAKALADAIKGKSFTLCRDDDPAQGTISRLQSMEAQPQTTHEPPSLGRRATTQSEDDATPTNGVRPAEMKLVIGAIFFVLHVSAFVTFLVLFIKAATGSGLALPSNSTFVRQLVENYIPIAVATLMEPFWLVLNRYLAMLQPFEELRRGSAKAQHSTDVDYSSLPPQMLFGRAMRAVHLVLMLVSLMVLLANILAVALSGLMYEGTQMVQQSATISRQLTPIYRSVNGSGLPFNTYSAHNWQGGTTSTPFYLMMSNLTAHTPIPAWTDDDFAYVPVEMEALTSSAAVRFDTTAFGADLECSSITTSGNQNYSLIFDKHGRTAKLDVNLQKEDGSIIGCHEYNKWTADNFDSLNDSQDGHVALEFSTMLASNKTNEDNLFCRQHLLTGWMRVDWKTIAGEVGTGDGLLYYNDRNMTITSRNETVLLCKPTLQINMATITVDSEGQVLSRQSMKQSQSPERTYFNSSSQDLLAQANQFLVDSGATWHKDSYPSDFLNYLIAKTLDDYSMLNPSLPPARPEYAALNLAMVYKRLFAIFVSSNANLLFETSPDPTSEIVTSKVPQTRILFSTPAFIVTETILAIYIIVTVFFYARRPWRVLPRLPSSPASIIAYFAASWALQDLSSQRKICDGKTRRRAWKWAYGIFIGTDGKSHTGIDREPLVTVLRATGRDRY
ncbi:hypothetical protein HII31_13020 [Pseudocercospora fuligena]|uniref:Uncharacterized protein n=1 Tax=Pseudocercospora fuligena TaxID=685502 RepID=A0A8H6R5V1_9PEZI|nr:hypothetical protein HII31_13020 [Pseudocercospora fuligena]